MIAHNLPAQPTPFFSRSVEMAEIASLLADPACRLLTLIGPGGIGKTRLAVEAAHQMLQSDGEAHFPQGVYFVSLQPLASPDLIIPAIATALDIRFFQTSDMQQELLDTLREKVLLLVLDNFEHLLDGAESLSYLLAGAPGVQMLVTSRERLNLREEWVLEVGGLSYPISEGQHDIERYGAVQFFLQNAQRVQVGFQLTEAQKPAVAHICRLVSGMPLGIELAAAWVRVMSCDQIATEVERSLDVLETPARNVPARHRNMRAVFEPTWTRLPDAEQQVFMRLSVFRDGFTREAAQAVAGATLPTLSALVDKSLLKVDADGRYTIHELLRQYGDEHLKQSGAEQQTRASHSAYYAEFLHQREADLKGRRQLAALDEIETDYNNVRTAWVWLTEHRDYEAIDASFESLFLFCDMRSRFHEVSEFFRYTWEMLTPSDGETAHPVWGRLISRTSQGSPDGQFHIKDLREKALAIARVSTNEAEIGYCLWRLGEAANHEKDYSSAINFLEECLVYLRRAGDQYYEAKALNEFGFPYRGMGQPEKAIIFQQQSLILRRKIGDERGICWCLFDIGRSLTEMARYSEAETYFQEAYNRWQTIRDRLGIQCAISYLGYITFAKGDLELARVQSQQGIDIAIELNLPDNRILPSLVLSAITAVKQDYAEAKRLCDEVLTALPSCWVMPLIASGLDDYPGARQSMQNYLRQNSLGDVLHAIPTAALIMDHEGQREMAVELMAFISGQPSNILGWIKHWQPFTDLRTKLENELSPHVFMAAWERGAKMSLEAMLNFLRKAFQVDISQSANQNLIEPLSERELEVLNAIASGSSNSEIAAQMVVEISTIKKHLNHIYDKLEVKSRTQAIVRGREIGLL